jgi:predicted AlkP superfamily pyrophosphatase or phosphodiesterase
VWAALMLALACASSACSARYLSEERTDSTSKRPAASLSRHVVIVSIDGLRPDAIASFRPSTLERLIREGSFTLSATTILPSKTLPSHTSMLTGVGPDLHGVRWNNVATADTDIFAIPSVFSLARQHGYATAAFFSKAKFQPLQVPGTLDYTQAPGGLAGRWSSRRTMRDVGAYLQHAKPNVLFVHLTDPDAAGHRWGWMTPAYGRAVLEADAALAKLLELCAKAFGDGTFSLIVTADHGGHDFDHGSKDPRDVTIPWIAWGQGVAAGELAGHIQTMDTAATALWLLGLTPPGNWEGTPVARAYDAPAESTGRQELR